jgi:hypothetical protein
MDNTTKLSSRNKASNIARQFAAAVADSNLIEVVTVASRDFRLKHAIPNRYWFFAKWYWTVCSMIVHDAFNTSNTVAGIVGVARKSNRRAYDWRQA